MRYVIAFSASLIAAAALFGWGDTLRRLTRFSIGGWPLTVGLGFGVVIFLGGLCNDFHIARPLVFDTIILLGLAQTAPQLRRLSLQRPDLKRIAGIDWSSAALIALILASGAFVIATQLPPVTFNHHDDFEKYIPQVVRMLATGTVHDNPLGSIGIETLGGQTVLQAFIAANFPIEYINGADALFCLLLSLLMLGGIAFERPAIGPAMLAGAIALVAIDPHYANISGIYSIVALTLTLVIATCLPADTDADRSHIETIVGLLYAAQIAIKLTTISFIGLHFLCWIGCIAWLCRDWRLALARSLKTGLWSALFLSPWVVLFAPDFLLIFLAPPGPPTIPKLPDHTPQFESLLTIDPYLPVAWYSAAATLVLACGCAVLIRMRRVSTKDPLREHGAAFMAFCLAVAANYVLFVTYIGPYFADMEAAVRYTAPFLIAGVGAALTLSPVFLGVLTKCASSRKVVWTFACIGIGVLAMFGRSLQDRVTYALRYGMPQSYVRFWQPQARQAVVAAMADTFEGKLHAAVQDAQRRVPPGSRIVVWMVTPFLLDYGRNPIAEIGWYQLVRPWSLIPQTDYVIWQYSGFGVRQPPEYAENIRGGIPMLAKASIAAIEFGNHLQKIWNKSQILYNDNGIVVLHVTCANGLAQC